MKKLIAILPAVILVFALCSSAEAAYDPNINYSQEMINACLSGDWSAGIAAQDSRNEKIKDLGLNEISYTFEELMLLSKIIHAEAGSEWLSDEWKMCVGEVVINRVKSPEFPNTIREVIEQPGQYYGSNSRYFNNLLPSERSVRCALRLLRGERLLQPSVVYQANFAQGGGTHLAYYDRYLGWTYFCYSTNMQLYQE